MVGHAVVVGVVVADEIGGLGHIEAAAVPLDAERHGDLVGKGLGAVKDAVAVPIFKQTNAERWLVERFLVAGVLPGRLAEEQAAAIVKGEKDSVGDQVGSGGHFHLKPFGYLDGIDTHGPGAELKQKITHLADAVRTSTAPLFARKTEGDPGDHSQGEDDSQTQNTLRALIRE